jgi:hypothetical protein
LVGGLWNKGGGDEKTMVMVVELGWWLEFSFEAKLAWGCMRKVHLNLYMVVGRVRKD